MTLQLQDITHAYATHTVLDGITASAEPGRVTVLVGPNAAGKTTLLRISAGLLHPDAGTVRYKGDDLHALNEAQRAMSVAMATQRPRSDIPLSVREIIAIGRHRRLDRSVDPIIDALELGDVLGRPYQSLSVGQQQRVGIARLLHQHERGGLLVLDEPTAPLDPRHSSCLLQLLREAAANGAAVLLSMHDLALAAAVADDAWILDEGVLTHDGHAAEVLHPDALEAAFGLPFERLTRSDGSHWLAPKA